MVKNFFKKSNYSKLINLAVVLIAFLALSFLVALFSFNSNFSGLNSLSNYKPKLISRVISNSGDEIGGYGDQKRVFIPIDLIPEKLIYAFISAEDKNFYNNPGIDFLGILRALFGNVKRKITGSGTRSGASTITQQVAKNMLLSSTKTYERKIKEAMLASKMTIDLSKDKIMELYLNEIYLGMGAYGIGIAAKTYFSKSLDELSVSQMAFLAALPKAPNHYNPFKNKKRAIDRRNWVLKRMLIGGYISEDEYEKSSSEDLEVQDGRVFIPYQYQYFAEEVRRILLDNF